MFVDEIYEFHKFFLKLLTLSDPTFYHLLGLLAVFALLRLFVPLNYVMVRELLRRNEIADLAEEEHCNEYDIFVKAHKFITVQNSPKKSNLILSLTSTTGLTTIYCHFICGFFLRNLKETTLIPETIS